MEKIYASVYKEYLNSDSINKLLEFLRVLNLTQIGKLFNKAIVDDVYQKFKELYLLEKLKESDLKEIREFIRDIGRNKTEFRDELVRDTTEKLSEVDLVQKIKESNLNETQWLIHNINKTGYDAEFVVKALKEVDLIPKIEEASLNDINMLIHNIDLIGAD